MSFAEPATLLARAWRIAEEVLFPAAPLVDFRAAATLAVVTGSRSVQPGDPAARLVREAAFLLVFGTRPAIRAALLDRLA